MDLREVYVGIGGNIGNSYLILQEALRLIKAHPGIYDLEVSRFYKTSPVSPLPQNDYVNAVCRFQTALIPIQVLKILQDIEKMLGKKPKPKEAPRIIDCDILFFGDLSVSTQELQIPHPSWRERLFVLAPLSELVTTLRIPGLSDPINLQTELQTFTNRNRERIHVLKECAG